MHVGTSDATFSAWQGSANTEPTQLGAAENMPAPQGSTSLSLQQAKAAASAADASFDGWADKAPSSGAAPARSPAQPGAADPSAAAAGQSPRSRMLSARISTGNSEAVGSLGDWQQAGKSPAGSAPQPAGEGPTPIVLLHPPHPMPHIMHTHWLCIPTTPVGPYTGHGLWIGAHALSSPFSTPSWHPTSVLPADVLPHLHAVVQGPHVVT